jgi:hypothetical protein
VPRGNAVNPPCVFITFAHTDSWEARSTQHLQGKYWDLSAWQTLKEVNPGNETEALISPQQGLVQFVRTNQSANKFIMKDSTILQAKSDHNIVFFLHRIVRILTHFESCKQKGPAVTDLWSGSSYHTHDYWLLAAVSITHISAMAAGVHTVNKDAVLESWRRPVLEPRCICLAERENKEEVMSVTSL